MSFDWPIFLTRNNIDYVTSSRYHVTAGNIAICCPFCPNDSTYNLHISLHDKGWHCFRQENHRSTIPQPLVQRLLNCSYSYANAIVQEEATADIPTDDDFLTRLNDLFNLVGEPMKRQISLKIPSEFRPIKPYGSGIMFISYMSRRGFNPEDIPELCQRYDIKCCIEGQYYGRIIFLIWMNGKLVSWTGRHIGGSSLRYLSLSVDDSKTPALETIKETILWYDKLSNESGTLVVCEGPFDALKVNYLGESQNIHATCVFGKSISDKQLDLLESLKGFKRKILLLDTDASEYQFNPRGKYASLEAAGFKAVILPKFVKDPGEFDKQSFNEVLTNFQ